MSSETFNMLVGVMTFLVIAATAAAAIRQLRHMQVNNQLQAMLTINALWNSPELTAASDYVRHELAAKQADESYQSVFRAGAQNRREHPEMLVATWWEQIGVFVKYGFLLKDPFMDLASSQIDSHWSAIAPTIGLLRFKAGPMAFENFEFLAVEAREWMRRHPDGCVPPGMVRLPTPEPGSPAKEVP